MKETFKEVFNLKTILYCYISAIGYGVGYRLPAKFNLHPIICLICCFVLGAIFDKLAEKILDSKTFTSSKTNKILIIIIIYSSYLIAWLICDVVFEYDLDNDFLAAFGLIIVFQIILIIYRIIKKTLQDKKKESTINNTKELSDEDVSKVSGGEKQMSIGGDIEVGSSQTPNRK